MLTTALSQSAQSSLLVQVVRIRKNRESSDNPQTVTLKSLKPMRLDRGAPVPNHITVFKKRADVRDVDGAETLTTQPELERPQDADPFSGLSGYIVEMVVPCHFVIEYQS